MAGENAPSRLKQTNEKKKKLLGEISSKRFP